MINKKGLAILILLGLELMSYSFRFIQLSPEAKLLPSEEVNKNLSNRNLFDKLNGSCVSLGNFNINQGIFLNSENINGYNPIFPKRLLRVVNAALGRDTNWVESVSLSMKDVSGPVFRLAGVNSCTDKDTTSVNQTPADNIFTGFDIVDDAKFYEDITKGTDIISENKISILNSDKQLVPPPLGSACKNQKSPNLEVISSNKLKISSECDFYYVNPYLYYPGWFATDGKDKSKAFPAFGFLQGYRITAGSKEVEFVYFPSP